MATTSDFAIVYDLSSNKERKLIYSLLCDYGTNVQRSVFECRLTKNAFEQLMKKLQQLQINTGTIKIYRLVSNNQGKEFGKANSHPDDSGAVFII